MLYPDRTARIGGIDFDFKVTEDFHCDDTLGVVARTGAAARLTQPGNAEAVDNLAKEIFRDILSSLRKKHETARMDGDIYSANDEQTPERPQRRSVNEYMLTPPLPALGMQIEAIGMMGSSENDLDAVIAEVTPKYRTRSASHGSAQKA